MRTRQLAAFLALLCLAFGPLPASAADDEKPPVEQCYTLRPGVAGPRPVCISSATYFADVCRAIETFAHHYGLPPAFFARLIWQESRFDPMALSPVGAQGIAQFMPGTAAIRGLRQSFQPAEALAYSAEYLHFLEKKYGNLGLAAAAYNSGEGRVSRWLGTGGWLPAETRNYVMTITGNSTEAWEQGELENVDYTLQADKSFQEGCIEMTKRRPMPTLVATESADWKPWGVLIAQAASPTQATAAFDRAKARFDEIMGSETMLLLAVRNPSFGPRPRHSAMVGRDSRDEAESLCKKLKAAGGTCLVVGNKR